MKAKKTRTRREKALLRGAVLLVLLVLYMILAEYGFSRQQVVRGVEELVNCSATEQLLDKGAMPLSTLGKNRLELWGNEDVLLLVVSRWRLTSGWQEWGFDALDCSGEGPVYLGAHSFRRKGEELCYFFGRIDLPQAALLQVEMGYGGEKWVLEELVESPASTWLKKGESFYVLFPLPNDESWEHKEWVYPKARLLDEAGEVLWETDWVPMGGTAG